MRRPTRCSVLWLKRISLLLLTTFRSTSNPPTHTQMRNAVYQNENDVAAGIAASSVKRENIFITTKLLPQDMGTDLTKEAIEQSLKNLNTDYIDLYIHHHPSNSVSNHHAPTHVTAHLLTTRDAWCLLTRRSAPLAHSLHRGRAPPPLKSASSARRPGRRWSGQWGRVSSETLV